MTQEVKAIDLVPGDVIREGNKRVLVLRVDKQPRLCLHHVHVNDTACYNTGDLVTVE